MRKTAGLILTLFLFAWLNGGLIQSQAKPKSIVTSSFASDETVTQDFPMGDDKGNGKGIVCFDSLEARDKVEGIILSNRASPHHVDPFEFPVLRDSITTVRLFDLYEHQLRIHSKFIELISLQGSIDRQLKTVIRRLDPQSCFANELDGAYFSMPLANWQPDLDVLEINDPDNKVIIPGSCLLMRMASLKEGRVFYHETLFSMMKPVDQVGLILHELVHKIGVHLGKEDPMIVRRIVASLLLKDQWQARSEASYYTHIWGLCP